MIIRPTWRFVGSIRSPVWITHNSVDLWSPSVSFVHSSLCHCTTGSCLLVTRLTRWRQKAGMATMLRRGNPPASESRHLIVVVLVENTFLSHCFNDTQLSSKSCLSLTVLYRAMNSNINNNMRGKDRKESFYNAVWQLLFQTTRVMLNLEFGAHVRHPAVK